MHDPEQRRRGPAARGGGTLGPERRAAHGFIDVGLRGGELHADVEDHRNVDTERLLKRDDRFRRELVLAAVEVRAKAHAGIGKHAS